MSPVDVENMVFGRRIMKPIIQKISIVRHGHLSSRSSSLARHTPIFRNKSDFMYVAIITEYDQRSTRSSSGKCLDERSNQ